MGKELLTRTIKQKNGTIICNNDWLKNRNRKLWKKWKNKKQEDKFKDITSTKVHGVVLFANLKHKKNQHIHKSTYGLFIFKEIYNGLFVIITMEFSPLIKCVLGPKFSMLVNSTTTLDDIFQFSFINIKKLILTTYLINKRLTIKGRRCIKISYSSIRMGTKGPIWRTINWSRNLKIINI